jgi:hypothetical protein
MSTNSGLNEAVPTLAVLYNLLNFEPRFSASLSSIWFFSGIAQELNLSCGVFFQFAQIESGSILLDLFVSFAVGETGLDFHRRVVVP